METSNDIRIRLLPKASDQHVDADLKVATDPIYRAALEVEKQKRIAAGTWKP